MTKKLACIIVVFVAMCAGVSPGEAGVPAKLTHWAILADSEVGDLLTAELSERNTLELVERVKIEQVLKEQQLAAMSQTAARIELGKILAASRLLSVEQIGKQHRIRVFDTDCGALLFDVNLDESNLETLCKNIGLLVDLVEERYRNGIRAVVAVTHLVSKNFDRSLASLQFDYAALTTAALLRYEGIAVVALDELESIRREIILGDKNIENRIVPFIIQGEYTVNRDEKGATQTVNLKVEIKDGEAVRFSIEKPSLSLAEAAALFSEEVPQAVLQRLDGTDKIAPLDIAQQKAALAKTADLLKATGAADLAQQYREAIFLLDPDDLENVLRLIFDNNVEVILADTYLESGTPDSRSLGAIQLTVSDRYYSLPYIEHIFRAKKCSLIQGQQIFSKLASRTSVTDKRYLDERKNRMQPTIAVAAPSFEGPPGPDQSDPLNIRQNHSYALRLAPLLCALPASPEPESFQEMYRGYNPYAASNRFRHDHALRDFAALFTTMDFATVWGFNQEKDFTKEFAKRFFEYQILLPKKVLFYGYARRYDYYFRREFSSSHLLRAVPWETWTYFCDLWRETKDEDYIFFADYLEVLWKYANQAKLQPGEFDNEVIPKINSMVREYWLPKDTQFPRELTEREMDLLQIAYDLVDLEKLVQKQEKYHEVTFWFADNRNLLGIREFKLIEKTGDERFHRTGESFGTRMWNGSFPDYPESRFPLKTAFTVRQIDGWKFPLEDSEGRRLLSRYDLSIQYSQNSFRGYHAPHVSVAGGNPSTVYIEKLNDQTDIVWDHRRIMRIDAVPDGTPLYERIYPLPDPQKDQESILCVSCDGQNIWVSTADGVLVLDPSGKILTRFTESDQLPAYQRPDFRADVGILSRRYTCRQEYLALFATAPGECIAVGSTASSQTWVAKLTFEPDAEKKHVQFLLGTTRQLTQEQQSDPAYIHSAQQIDVTFFCPWFSWFSDSKHPQRRQLLLGRVFGAKPYDIWTPSSRTTPSIPSVPLLIDLDENKIMLLTERYPDLNDMLGGVAVRHVNDSFVVHQGEDIRLYRRDESGVYESVVLTDEKTRDSWESNHSFKQNPFFFADGNKVYSPGVKWYCFDLSDPLNPQTEIVATATYPKYQKLRGYSESAVFGIWAQYTEGAPWSLDIRTPTDTVIDLFKNFVPPEHYAKHEAARDRIEQLGGHVYLGSARFRAFFVDGKLQDGTILHLDENWKGTQRDAELFKDLYRLSAVYFVNAPVGDEEFRQLYMIPTISDLFLIRTKVSEEAVQKFPLQQLVRIILENKEDEPIFTDRLLESLVEKGNIKVLFYSGPGFTDASYELLKKLPVRPHVEVKYGSITEDVFLKINKEFGW